MSADIVAVAGILMCLYAVIVWRRERQRERRRDNLRHITGARAWWGKR